MYFEALLLAALGRARAVRVQEAAVVHGEVGVLDGSIFEWLGAKSAAFEQAAAAHELRAESGIEPGQGREIKGLTQNEAFAGTLTDVRNEEAGLPDFASRGGGGVRKPDEGNAEQTEVGVDQGDSLVEANARFGSIELPIGAAGITDGDPGALHEIQIARNTLDGASFEIQRIVGEEDLIVGLALDFESAVNVLKEAVAGADVVVGFGGFKMLAAIVQLHVAGGDGFVGFVVVLDVIGA